MSTDFQNPRASARGAVNKGMRGVSRHCRDSDGVVLDVQTLIYPRYDLEPTT